MDKIIQVVCFGVFLALIPLIADAVVIGFDVDREWSMWELTKGGEAFLLAAAFAGATIGELAALETAGKAWVRRLRFVGFAMGALLLAIAICVFTGLKATTETECSSPGTCITEPTVNQGPIVAGSGLTLVIGPDYSSAPRH